MRLLKPLYILQKSISFGWNYDEDVIKITALTGSAACEIPNGRTLHSQACLSFRKIGGQHKETWVNTNMLIISSFVTCAILKRLIISPYK